MNIKRITIRGLFDHADVTIPIKDNKLILIGANGLGKSTVLNIVYSFLSRRWEQLARYRFSSVEIEFDSVAAYIERSALVTSNILAPTPWASAPDYRRWMSEPEMSIQKLISVPRKMLRMLLDVDLRRAHLMPYLTLSEQAAAQAFLSADINKPIVDEILGNGPIGSTLDKLDVVSDYRIMFLPTYRRIERDLNHIFPNADEIINRYQRLRSRSAAVEFVQFGMDDVRALFESTREQLQLRSFRVRNQTSSSYLQDVLRGQAREYDPDLIKSVSVSSLERIMSNASLTQRDLKRLREVTKLVRADGQLNEDDSLIAHYLIKLIDAMNKIAAYEHPVQNFVNTVNSYLSGKRIAYDQDDFKLSINSENNDAVELRDLSSGEKQIVSLFAHAFLEDVDNLIFIDEPELSLSVDWQMRFLPDLAHSRRCKLLMAVTHSPFVFDNELEPYAVDLRALRQ